MTGAIWKFPLPIIDEQVVEMPANAKILSAQIQNNDLCLWARVEPKAEKVKRIICVHGTGHEIDFLNKSFIGTVQIAGFNLVFHIFERHEP